MSVDLARRILQAILEDCRVPDDLGYLLARRDPEALSQLLELLEGCRRLG